MFFTIFNSHTDANVISKSYYSYVDMNANSGFSGFRVLTPSAYPFSIIYFFLFIYIYIIYNKFIKISLDQV